jgi:general secretion pathway protein C
VDMNAVTPVAWQIWTLRCSKLVLTLLLAWQSSQMVWMLAAPAPLVLQQPARGERQDSAQQVAGSAAYHLFGEAALQEAAAVVVAEVDAPETRLRLTLLGVTLATPETASSAIIAANGKESDFFRIGDTVDGRTRLASVRPDRVLLDTSGKLETLKFEEVATTGSSVQAVDARPPRPPKRTSGGAGNSLQERFGAVRNADEFVDVASDALGDDPVAAIRKMGLEPRGDGEGYEVKPGSPLLQFELKPGDVVLSLNDQPLGDPSSDQSLLDDIKTADSVRIEVQRGDNRFVVNHRLN